MAEQGQYVQGPIVPVVSWEDAPDTPSVYALYEGVELIYIGAPFIGLKSSS